jgi:hypothetical protein
LISQRIGGFCSAGAFENSLAFQRRERIAWSASPGGTVELPVVPPGLFLLAALPAVKTAGYFQMFLRNNRAAFVPPVSFCEKKFTFLCDYVPRAHG